MSTNGTKFWTVVGVLAMGMIATTIALSAYATSAYKSAMENRERIAVLESTQQIILDKVTEIGHDVKDLLKANRRE